MSFSSSRGFSPATLLAGIRSEVHGGYRRTRTPGLVYDPWFGSDPMYATARAGAPGVSW